MDEGLGSFLDSTGKGLETLGCIFSTLTSKIPRHKIPIFFVPYSIDASI